MFSLSSTMIHLWQVKRKNETKHHQDLLYQNFIKAYGGTTNCQDLSMLGARGGGWTGLDPFLKNHKNIGFLSKTGLDPLKLTKLPSQYSMLGHHRPASETPLKWRFAGGQC